MIDCFNFSCAEKDEYLSLDQIVEYSFTCKADFLQTRDAQMLGSQVLPCTIVPRDQVVTKITLTLGQLVTNNNIAFHWLQGI